MPVVEESVVIARPPQEVFDFVSKFQNVAVFDSSVTSSEQVGDGPLGVGTRGRGTSKVMGRQFDWTVEVTEFDPPRRFAHTFRFTQYDDPECTVLYEIVPGFVLGGLFIALGVGRLTLLRGGR